MTGKVKKTPKPKDIEPRAERRPTLLEFLASFTCEAYRELGQDVKIDSDLTVRPLPHWGKNIMGQFGKTILKPIVKLRPSAKTTCQDYGKLVGIINRGITFYRTDSWQMLEQDGLDDITAEDWERIQPESQLRKFTIRKLGRVVREDEKLDDLIFELIEKQIKHLENLRSRAFQFMAGRSAKDNAMFHKGMAQGYGAFMDVYGQFCGDRGRTEIYMQLISSVHEIEKMRRMLPAKNDSDLYEHLRPWYRFPGTREDGVKWLRKVCDDISLYITGKRGRPGGSRSALAF